MTKTFCLGRTAGLVLAIAVAAFGTLITSEVKRWKPVVERANMRPE